MSGETLNATPSLNSTATAPRCLPKNLLYSIFARIGGSGLDTDAFEALRAIAWRCSGVIVCSLAFPPFLPSSARYFESRAFLSMAADCTS